MPSYRSLENQFDSLHNYFPSHEIELAGTTKKICAENSFEVRAFKFDAHCEQSHAQRIVRVAAVQHSIVMPTSVEIPAQRNALFEKIEKLIRAAAASKVNILCLAEAWSKLCIDCSR